MTLLKAYSTGVEGEDFYLYKDFQYWYIVPLQFLIRSPVSKKPPASVADIQPISFNQGVLSWLPN